MLKPWKFEGASCWGIETDFFFPEEHRVSNENKMAKEICKSCIWKTECLTYALHYSVTGIWGGTSHKERSRIRTKLNIIPIPLIRERAS